MDDSNRDRAAQDSPGVGQAESKNPPMSHTIEVNSELGYLHVTTRGRASGDGFVRMSQELWAHPAWLQGFNLLLDHRPLDSRHLTSLEIRQISNARPDSPDGGAFRRIASVVETDLGFGLTRMWDFFTDGDSSREHRIFRSIEEAQCWLKESSDATSTEDESTR